MVSLPKKSLLLLTCMLIATSLGFLLKPTLKMAEQGPKFDLETMIPKEFEGWHELTQKTAFIISPVQKEAIDNIYAQTLSRTYMNKDRDVLMLSIAYGADQSDAMRVHKPEVCYGAQGFEILEKQLLDINSTAGKLSVRRLVASLGPRVEPVTYWITVGDEISTSGTMQKLTQLKYGLSGKIPDGLLFRVSTIGDVINGYEVQQQFIDDLLISLSDDNKKLLVGSR